MEKSDIRERARRWMESDPDEETAAALRALLESEDEAASAELAECMAGPLKFGTAGLRGVIGPGEHRMNRAVIRQTTAGLAAYLMAQDGDAATKGVVIGYDGRRMSETFARDAAGVLAGAGVVAHLFPKMVPTPLVAFAVSELSAAAGVMITASHNPPEYNGYKVFWSTGAQIVPPHDRGIAAAIATVGPAKAVPVLAEDEARSEGLLQEIDPPMYERYLDSVSACSKVDQGREGLKIVYSAMHGVGDAFTQAALRRFGFDQTWSVPEQQQPDGEFPTVRYPNPEEPGALDLSLSLAAEVEAELVLVNDPDADRLAVAIPVAAGGYRQLTGNEVGILIGEYLLRQSVELGPDRLVMTTVVSSPLLGEIARALGVIYEETLTGFKWIASRAMTLERERGARFIFGYEEALGYTIGTAVRDKDGVSAAAVFAELTAVARAQGSTIERELERIARTYGFFLSDQRALVHRGADGAAKIAAMMTRLHQRPPSAIGDREVQVVRDFQRGLERRGGVESPLDFPAANVVALDLDGGARVVARPSGTEPKIKFYFDLREIIGPDEPFSRAYTRGRARITTLAREFLELMS